MASALTVKKVAIIGAGPSGLCVLRTMSEYPDELILTAFDKNKDVGGMWNYTEDTETDEKGVPTYATLYKPMRTNIPKQVMGFADFQFEKQLPSFCHHSEVIEFWQQFTDHFNIRKYIKLQTFVTEVKPEVIRPGHVAWHVTTRDLLTDEMDTSAFDAVVMCNGPDCVVNWPDYPGEETFTGTLLHSKNLRDLEIYRDKVVLILGKSYSAADLIFILSPIVSKLYVSHRGDPLAYPIPANVQEVPCIKDIISSGARLENGDVIASDVIIYATGYKYNLSMLSDNCGVKEEDGRIYPLYKHMFNSKFPSMCFVGLIRNVFMFQVSAQQAQYACAVLRGKLNLPTEADMMQDEARDYEERITSQNLPANKTHDLQWTQFKYCSQLADEAGFPKIHPVLEKMLQHFLPYFINDFGKVKDINYRIVDEENFETC